MGDGDPPALVNHWDPRTGRGHVEHRLASGALRTCFHCDYAGYTGGLVIGAFNGSGMGFVPTKPIRGHAKINVFCAQDESIWDRTEKRELSYGWSENFGTGPDGARLEYVRGRIIEEGPERVTLQSENEGGCYRVVKVATTRARAPFWVIATRVVNRCDHAIHFDFFTGDDPWIGLYKSSEGDVGWTQDGLVRREKVLGPGAFFAGGLYDLGNVQAGEREGGFSNQANFFLLDPTLALPSFVAFANSFAHQASDVDPDRPLDDATMTALNLGWVDQRLEPGEGVTLAQAVGLAKTDERGARLPSVPAVTDEDWSIWRRHLPDGKRSSSAATVDFVSERVELDLSADRLAVHATYTLFNRSRDDTVLSVRYPILTTKERPAPSHVDVDGKRYDLAPGDGTTPAAASRAPDEVRFPIEVPARSLRRFDVRYVQAHSGRSAGYLVTSARRWPHALTRAVFVIRHPRSMSGVRVSYDIDHSRVVGDTIEHVIVEQPFQPSRELELSW